MEEMKEEWIEYEIKSIHLLDECGQLVFRREIITEVKVQTLSIETVVEHEPSIDCISTSAITFASAHHQASV